MVRLFFDGIGGFFGIFAKLFAEIFYNSAEFFYAFAGFF